MSVTHDMMLFLDRTSHCLVCKMQVDVYTRHKNLDDVVQVAGGRTVRSCLQQVLDVSLACSSAIWLCNKCYADLEQIQLYYNLVKHFRERFHNAVQLGSTHAGVVAASPHAAYGAHQYDDRGLHGQPQQYNNHSLMVHTGQQNADLLLSLGGTPPNNQGPSSLDPSIQPYHKYEPPPPPPPPPPLPQHQPQQQQMHQQQQPHQVQQQHDQQQQQNEQQHDQQQQPQRSPTSVQVVKKTCEGDFLDNILNLPVIQDVQIKKEVDKFVSDVGSDEDDAAHEEEAVSAEGMTGTSSGVCLGDSNSPSEGVTQADTSKPKACNMDKEPGQSDFKCTICNQSFKTEIRLKRHMLSHRRGGPLKCSICNKGFTSDKQLRLHKLCHAINVQSLGEKTETENMVQSSADGEVSDAGECPDTIDIGPKVYTCRICQKSFSQPKLLRMHKRTHTLAKYAERNGHPLQCPDCDERFDDAEGFKDHVKRQLCDWPWKCHICEAGFYQEAPLKRHLKTHVNESRITCPICHKRISDAGYMKEHIRVHTGELPHECTFCKKRFNNPSNLKQHERIHTGEKPYKCGVCGVGFRQIGQKKVHELTHSGKAPHVCPTCGKEFFWACSYKKHIQIHTNEKPELCSTCGKSFRNVPALHAHARSHSDARPHVCSYCGKGFKTSKHLSVHKRIHTGEKPFICELCGRGFSQTTGLKFHLKSHNVTSL